MSAEVNSSWPDEARFHFEILDIPRPNCQKGFRTHETFSVFGVSQAHPRKFNQKWSLVDSDEPVQQAVTRNLVELYPLRRGPSRRARFLVKVTPFGCAGSVEINYDARERLPVQGLVPIAKAIEFAQQWHYRRFSLTALSATLRVHWCGVFLSISGRDLQVTRAGIGKERVESEAFRFDVEKRSERWKIVRFKLK